jgi:hypothetical protein
VGARKKRLLDMTVAAIQRRWGLRTLRRGGEAPAKVQVPHIPTGFLFLDKALGMGGIPRGRITEMLVAPLLHAQFPLPCGSPGNDMPYFGNALDRRPGACQNGYGVLG